MTMPRSEDELAEALAQSEAWMAAVNPDEVPADAIDDRKDLRQIGVALISIEAAEQALVSAVANARANKRSWTDIANILGVSRQAARQRFDHRVADGGHAASAHLWIRPSAVAAGDFLVVATCLCHNLARMPELQEKVGTPLYDELNEFAELLKAQHEHEHDQTR
jgi:hypothetical protein